MATYNKIEAFPEHLAEKVHSLSADTLKILLANAAPSASGDAVRADLTSELGTAGGYTSGGTQAALVTSAQTAGTYKLVLSDVVFTATAAGIGPFRYAIFYNDTPTSPADPLIAWWDYGSSITLADGESFTVDFDGTTGVLTIA